jgi:hypothetical protein
MRNTTSWQGMIHPERELYILTEDKYPDREEYILASWLGRKHPGRNDEILIRKNINNPAYTMK